MVEEPTPTAAAADADVPAEAETLPEVEERPVTAEEETLPEAEERPAQELEADPAAAPSNIQVPTWNLDERIPIAPQVWDADTPQIGVGAADDDMEVVNLEDSPVVPEPPCISPKEKRIG
jgi:type IV secretory pathway VirB10-like protein